MNSKVLRRLLAVLTALEAHPGGLSAAELGEITGYPAGLILNDLNDMSYYTDFGGYFTLYSEDEEDLPGEDWESVNEFAGESYRVKNTDVKWYLLATSEPYPAISMNSREAMALLWLFEEYPPPGELVGLYKELTARLVPSEELAAAKDMARSLHARGGVALAGNEYLDVLREAVLNEIKIKARYYAKNWDEEVEWVLRPLGLVFYAGSGVWYMVALREDTGDTVVCHLERMRKVTLCSDKFSYPDDFSLREYLKLRWGMDMHRPETVRVRFYNEAGVVEKVLREFRARGMTPPVQLKDGSVEYHGEIMGINNFAKWILSFGSSAEVLEPAWLRQQMIETAQLWYGLYNEEIDCK